MCATKAKALAKAQYSVGIDLGTTHTVVAYAPFGSGKGTGKRAAPGGVAITLFAIPQLVSPGAVDALPLLPSARYHAAPGELAAADLALPWDTRWSGATKPPIESTVTAERSAEPTDTTASGPVVIGQLARLLGAQVPQRLVVSAKSWLSHAAVDRTAAILPWGAPPEVPKVSPVQASADTLAHVRAAWNAQFPASPLELQDIVLTLPASFDESARALTLQAAHTAGLPTLRLLEEPQAAFYDWLHRHRTDLSTALGESRLVLVCDVGGGTTDLSLIQIDMAQGQPQISRIGVGNHLMLGGDNMDLALAHTAEARLGGAVAVGFAQVKEELAKPAGDKEQNPLQQRPPGSARTDAAPSPSPTPPSQSASPPAPPNPQPLSASQLAQLMERCRSAKELLLAADAPDHATVTLLGTGARLVGASRSCTLTRAEVQAQVLDGFFPVVAADAPIQTGKRGLVAFGLPYARDAAITRHIAAFLRQHASTMPDTLLLNGGVFRAPALVQRLQDTLAAWRGAPLCLLHNDNPDVAVARGAVAYAMAQRGLAPTIGAGSARSYFLLLQGNDGQAPHGKGRASPQGICILPRLTQPGQDVHLSDRTFALRVGQPVRFHLCSASADAAQQAPYAAGQTVELNGPDFVRLPPIVTALATNANANANTDTTAYTGPAAHKEVPVQLVASLTEVGTLALHCVAVADPSQRWLLEFDLRHAQTLDDGDTNGASHDGGTSPRLGDAVKQLDRIFGTNAQKVDAKEVRQLRAQLEQLLGAREQWALEVLRPLFDTLWQRARGRRRSAEHERVWLNLAGYCLRPGWGDALDDWRVQQLWTLRPSGVQFSRDKQVCAQWWTLWRRAAGGLDAPAQLRLLDDFAYNLQSTLSDTPEEADARPSKPVKGEVQDMLRLGASLERIPAAYKVEVGNWLLQRIQKSVAAAAKASRPDTADTLVGLWALGRMGARQPLYGSTNDVAPPDAVVPWIEALLTLDWKRLDAAAFAATQIARVSDDRVRDLPHSVRNRVAAQLHASGAPATWEAMVRHKVDLDEAQQSRIVGESLPPGLKLIS
jgi:molecular chaperone DnaK (HSP70)